MLAWGRSSDREAALQVWTVTRGQGKSLPSGGTLVLGREQDCTGGCFDSMSGATGGLDYNSYREYGPQDFFGVMDEMRIWSRVRTQQEIIDVSGSPLGHPATQQRAAYACLADGAQTGVGNTVVGFSVQYGMQSRLTVQSPERSIRDPDHETCSLVLTDCVSAWPCEEERAVTVVTQVWLLLQGMKTALHRSGAGGSSFDGGSVSTDDKDLVAYWMFDEGQGYLISDATGHGHDLHATSNPHWQAGGHATALTENLSALAEEPPSMAMAAPMLGCSGVWGCLGVLVKTR